MSQKTPPPKYIRLNRAIHDYVLSHRTPDDAVVSDLRAETARLGDASRLQVSPEQATLLGLLCASAKARRALEVGTFTGLSALAIARGLAEGGTLLCLDVSHEWTSVARRYWERAGVSSRIELRLGPALGTLRALPAVPAFDFAFLDADKEGYPAYWEEIVTRLVPGGLVVVDNVLRGGDVLRAGSRAPGTRAVREFNDIVASDTRVDSVMLTIADGLTLARRL